MRRTFRAKYQSTQLIVTEPFIAIGHAALSPQHILQVNHAVAWVYISSCQQPAKRSRGLIVIVAREVLISQPCTQGIAERYG